MAGAAGGGGRGRPRAERLTASTSYDLDRLGREIAKTSPARDYSPRLHPLGGEGLEQHCLSLLQIRPSHGTPASSRMGPSGGTFRMCAPRQAIARSVVVEKHGGDLGFETEVGKGTTFFIRLPLEAKEECLA